MIISLILTITITFSYDSYHQIQLGFQVQGIRRKKVLKKKIYTHTHTHKHVYIHIYFYICLLKERKKVKFTSNSFQPPGLQPSRLLSPWNSPGQNTGVGSHSHLWGGGLPHPGIEPVAAASAGRFLTMESPGKPFLLFLLES